MFQGLQLVDNEGNEAMIVLEKNFEESRILDQEIGKVLDKFADWTDTDEIDVQNSLKTKIAQIDGIEYHASKGKYTIQTAKGPRSQVELNEYPMFVMITNNRMLIMPEELPKEDWTYSRFIHGNRDGNIYIGFENEFIEPVKAKWSETYFRIMNQLKIIGTWAGIFILCLIILLIVQWQGAKNENVRKGLYTDIAFFIGICVVIVWGSITLQTYIISREYIIFLTIATAFLASIGFLMLFSLVKHLAMGQLFKHSLAYTIFSKLAHVVKAMYSNGSLGVKVTLLLLLYTLLCSIVPLLAPIGFIVAIALMLRHIKDFNKLQQAMSEVKKGNFDQKVDLDTKGELATMGRNLNDISAGLEEAIQSELKSERLKAELITNVSHDIRTPLTSIITYVDLLKQETREDKRQEYLQVLGQKANRLKILTDDLFEAAKANSGNIEVNLEKIDVSALIKQSIGELNDKIKKNELNFMVKCYEEPCYVLADGRLLWRVIENLLSNVFKYTMPGTRVYWDVIEEQHHVQIILKNISNHALNVPIEELLQRFKRGDESRTTEGSGLGLSITKSLTELQQGKFDMEIDGDLFKTIITMPKYNVVEEVTADEEISEEVDAIVDGGSTLLKEAVIIDAEVIDTEEELLEELENKETTEEEQSVTEPEVADDDKLK